MELRLEQDKSVAQKTALCRISSLPAGALAFQRSEHRSDTAERCRREVCHNHQTRDTDTFLAFTAFVRLLLCPL